MESSGFLKVQVYAASFALPIEGARVRIFGSGEYGGGIDYSLLSDRRGATELIELPAPGAAYSRKPNSPNEVYATYTVEVSAEGFYPKTVLDVAVFEGILSIMPIELIPNAGFTRDTPAPRENNYTVIIGEKEPV